MTQRLLVSAILTSFLLAGCLVPKPQVQPNATTAASSSAQTVSSSAHSVSAPIVLTGSAAIVVEKTLSGGILEFGASGAPHALLVIVNHSSPYSRSFLLEQVLRLTQDFIKPGHLRLQLIPLKIEKYAKSVPQASAVLCASAQGKGMAMHEALASSDIVPDGKALGLNAKQYQTCLASADLKRVLEEQQEYVRQWGVSLAPTFYLDGERFEGLQQYADLRGRIREAIETQD